MGELLSPYRKEKHRERCAACLEPARYACRRCQAPLCHEHRADEAELCGPCAGEFQKWQEAMNSQVAAPHLAFIVLYGLATVCWFLAIVIGYVLFEVLHVPEGVGAVILAVGIPASFIAIAVFHVRYRLQRGRLRSFLRSPAGRSRTGT